ncbi:unnamed protein product [Moneuplotes crassus]|uniref:Uncharacterized protein n=1 Tax=Euplotes crassus TaxID=5936 RepID=A0AAD1XG91_EUPCR|nr:unnamed protein product [Moneuplotes crassus]
MSSKKIKTIKRAGSLKRNYKVSLSKGKMAFRKIYDVKHLRAKSLQKQRSILKAYNNVTGPGDYENVVRIGERIQNSQRRNQPAYSFGIRHDFSNKKPPVLSKRHNVDYYSRDSPCPGAYSPERSYTVMSQTRGGWSMSKDKRFKGPGAERANHDVSSSSLNRYEKAVSPGPGSYLGSFDRSSLMDFKELGKVGTESRFTKQNPLYKVNANPAPNLYNLSSYNSVMANSMDKRKGNDISLSGMNNKTMLSSTFGCTFDKYSSVYFKENSKAFHSRDTPGPGLYETDRSFVPGLDSLAYSFSKDDRKIKKIKTSKVSPVDFNFNEAFKKVVRKDLMVKMGKAKRELDFTKYSSQNNELVLKGIL